MAYDADKYGYRHDFQVNVRQRLIFLVENQGIQLNYFTGKTGISKAMICEFKNGNRYFGRDNLSKMVSAINNINNKE
jgi:hypothetical protein